LVQVHRDEAAGRNISLVAELAHDLPPVPADRRQLERVLLNLWQNALQSLDEVATSRERRLAVRTSTAAGTVKISFHDTGTGIPRHILPNIFTPFFTTKSRGTGLGLAVVKKIIEDHHGTVDVRSERRQGTVFTVTLPLPIGGG
jgi:signal transduction histidine kinase